MVPQQKERLAFGPLPPGIVVVNGRVSVRTEGSQRVISVHGVVFAHYDAGDRVAEVYTMVTLFTSRYADQHDIARSFGSSARSLRRYQERVEAGGLVALMRREGRPSGSHVDRSTARARDHTILCLKAKGFSNRAVAGRLGLDEKAIRER